MAAHRWSGWPGAWCLDCGCYDALEECLAVGCELGIDPDHPDRVCPIHVNHPCPEPNSGRCDPYRKKSNEEKP